MSDEPDFSDFEDWLVNRPAGEWPLISQAIAPFKAKQKQVVENNARMLSDKDFWTTYVQKFEVELRKIENQKARDSERARFEIRFDFYHFDHTSPAVDFQNAYFPCSTSFRNCEFGELQVSFRGAQFKMGNVSFDNAKFDGDVSFENVTFGDGDILFRKCRFTGNNAGFQNAKFGKGAVSFLLAVFNTETTGFENVNFGEGYTSFLNAQFDQGNVSFDYAIFGKGLTSFYGAEFGKGYLSFLGCELHSCEFSMENAKILGNLLIDVFFPKAARFERLTVDGAVRFYSSNFDETPDFRDALFDRPPDVGGMLVPKPELSERSHRIFKVCTDPIAVEKYRKLKSMALSANDHEKDGEFFAYEMMAKRGIETKGFWPLLFNTIYGSLSFYGQSFLRPASWLLGSFAAFSVAYAGLILPKLPSWPNLFHAVELSAKNTIPLLNSLFRFAASPDNYKSGFQKMMDALPAAGAPVDLLIYLGVIQQLTSGILLFFILLGLRNRFRLK